MADNGGVENDFSFMQPVLCLNHSPCGLGQETLQATWCAGSRDSLP